MEQTFKEIVARYCETKPEDMDSEKRFREDLGFSSLDFMSLLENWRIHLILSWRKKMPCRFGRSGRHWNYWKRSVWNEYADWRNTGQQRPGT